MKTQEYCIVSAYGNGSAVSLKLEEKKFSVSRDDGFQELIGNKLKTTNGFTVGQRNRAALHAALDAWIDKHEASLDPASNEQCERFNLKVKE